MRTPENLKAYDPQNLIRFINAQLPNNELTSWRIALMSKRNSSVTSVFQINGNSGDIGCFIRREDENNSDSNIYYLRKSHIISPKDEFIDLTSEEYARAMELTAEDRVKKNKEGVPSYPNGETVRNKIRDPKKPLLLIYLLDPAGAGMLSGSNPFVGYAISFPGSDFSAYVAYAVNEQLLDRFNIEENVDDFDDDEN